MKNQLTKEDILKALERRTMPKIKKYVSPTLEMMDIINAYELSYLEGNMFKYVARKGAKNDFDGLSKAYWYTLRELQYHAGNPLARLSVPKCRGPSVAVISKTFQLDPVQRRAVQLILRRTPDASKRIRSLLKIASLIKELLNRARPNVKAESHPSPKAGSRKKKLGEKRS